MLTSHLSSAFHSDQWKTYNILAPVFFALGVFLLLLGGSTESQVDVCPADWSGIYPHQPGSKNPGLGGSLPFTFSLLPRGLGSARNQLDSYLSY